MNDHDFYPHWVRIECSFVRSIEVNRRLLEFVSLWDGHQIRYTSETCLVLLSKTFTGTELADMLVEAEIINPIEEDWTCSQP